MSGGECDVGNEEVYCRSYEVVAPVVAEGGGNLKMFGRLRKCISFWEEMGASKFILNVLSFGYRLPFEKQPPAGILSNQASCLQHANFVSDAVRILIDSGSAVEMEKDQLHCISPLGVVQGANKLRLILDLRQVNVCLAIFRFKLEDIRTAVKLYKKGDQVVTFDLKSGYHHVDVAQEHWKYLGFQWNGKYFCFCSLPFGLSSAPCLFNKLVRVMVRYWRASGIKCMMFFDDGSAGASSREEAVSVANVLKTTLHKAGWVVNEEKSKLVPSSKPELLGFVLDLEEGKVYVSERRVKKFIGHLNAMLFKRAPTAKECAKLAGFIISMSFALGPVARLRTRGLYDMIFNRISWYRKVEWSECAREEVCFWKSCFDQFHGTLIDGKAGIVAVVETWSDASDLAWGGYVVTCGEVVAKGNWPEEVLRAQASSTWRELRAIELVLSSVLHEIKGKECRHRTDNQAAVRILQVGSKKPELQEIAVRIFKLCREHCIRLVPEWIPREQNERADFLSKAIDHDDWCLSHEIFQYLDEWWGPHSIDCFASVHARQLPRYCSRWWNPGCEAVDAFTIPWEGENLWLCPPIYLIGDVIERLYAEKCHGTLVIPEWKSAWWWPLLFKGEANERAVKASIYLPKVEGLFVKGECPWNWFNDKIPKSEVLAVRICSVHTCFCERIKCQ